MPLTETPQLPGADPRAAPRMVFAEVASSHANEAVVVQPCQVAVTNVAALPYLLTVREAALLLRTTQSAIYARAERGLLPGLLRDGRRILVQRDELLRSLSERWTASSGGFRR